MPTRFDPEINQMRAALRGKRGDELLAVLNQQLANLRVAALAADNTANYIASNEQAQQLTGYSAEEIRGLRLEDITPIPSTADAQHLWGNFIADGTQRGEYELWPRRGKPVRVRYWAYASVAPGIHVSLLTRVDSA